MLRIAENLLLDFDPVVEEDDDEPFLFSFEDETDETDLEADVPPFLKLVLFEDKNGRSQRSFEENDGEKTKQQTAHTALLPPADIPFPA